ncbi:hypothetical protein COMNV_01560 [Commensalibacter sp. Nvir]|uniref:DUF883 family protein n=1 Tax=Commensalibacter sp. Nvir TaxID=3069817 RepID=UPI002D67A49A|nr:hypothetical protein COMNV_01560 [Commensalibacter sp. Nvir]
MSNEMKDSLRDVVNEGKDKMRDTAQTAKENFEDVKDHASDHLSDAKKKMNDFSNMAEDEFKRLYGDDGKLEMMINFVKDRPLLSVGMAMGVGMIVSKMLRCCRRRS